MIERIAHDVDGEHRIFIASDIEQVRQGWWQVRFRPDGIGSAVLNWLTENEIAHTYDRTDYDTFTVATQDKTVLEPFLKVVEELANKYLDERLGVTRINNRWVLYRETWGGEEEQLWVQRFEQWLEKDLGRKWTNNEAFDAFKSEVEQCGGKLVERIRSDTLRHDIVFKDARDRKKMQERWSIPRTWTGVHLKSPPLRDFKWYGHEINQWLKLNIPDQDNWDIYQGEYRFKDPRDAAMFVLRWGN